MITPLQSSFTFMVSTIISISNNSQICISNHDYSPKFWIHILWAIPLSYSLQSQNNLPYLSQPNKHVLCANFPILLKVSKCVQCTIPSPFSQHWQLGSILVSLALSASGLDQAASPVDPFPHPLSLPIATICTPV